MVTKKKDRFFSKDSICMRKTGNIQDMSAHFSQFWRVDWVLKANKRDTVYAHVIRRHWRWDVLKSRLSLWDSAFYKVEISNKNLIIHKSSVATSSLFCTISHFYLTCLIKILRKKNVILELTHNQTTIFVFVIKIQCLFLNL